MEKELFPQKQLRDHKGRYCTKQQKKNDMLAEENKKLRWERDKYYRAFMVLAQRNSSLERELITLKAKLKELV